MILESGDLGVMVFTKAHLRRSPYCKVKQKVISGEDGVDLRIKVRWSLTGRIEDSK